MGYSSPWSGLKPASTPPRTNTRPLNVRNGESYQSSVDPRTGRTVHTYQDPGPGLRGQRIVLPKKAAADQYAGINFADLDRLIKSQQGASAPAAPAPPPDPRDAEFGAGAARLLHDNKSQRDGIELQGSQDQTDFDTMLKRMAESRGQDLTAQDHRANSEGLFYSGQLGKRRGDVEKGYSEREADQRTDMDRRVSARAAALRELGTLEADDASPLGFRGTGRAGLDLNELFGAAVRRRLERDQGMV